MKRLTVNNVEKILKKNQSLVKSTKDSTIVYVFSGHPYDSYMGREDDDILLMYSLSTNSYRKVTRGTLDSREEKFFLVENEEDVVGTLEDDEKKTYRKFLDRIDKVFR